jgi:hypothetical protein
MAVESDEGRALLLSNREMNDCRRYAADQKAKYDDDDRF